MNRFFKIAVPLLLALVIVATAGCAASRTEDAVMSPGITSRGVPAPMPAPMAPSMEKATTSTSGYQGGEANSTLPDTDRKIIRTGQITLEVTVIAKAIDEVATIATELGGYVVSSNKYGTEDRASGRVAIRIPATRFNEAFIKLRAIAVKVPNESTNSQDITEEYTDLKARLRNLEATEAQFLALLQQAKTVEEILKVQKELSNVRGEIERVKGRIQYFDRTTEMSLIEVNLQETKTVGKDGWSVLDTFKSAVNGLIGFGKVLANIVIWLVIFIPLWVIIWLIVFFVRRWRKKRKSKIT
jgi:hypothetical protein